MLRRFLCGVTLAVLVSLIFAPAPVAAEEIVFVHGLFDCDVFTVSPRTSLSEVPAGATVVVRWGWVADSLPLVQIFLRAADYSIRFDAEDVEDTDQFFRTITNVGDRDGDGDDDFRVLWLLNLGVLGPGVHDLRTDLSLSRPVLDLIVFDGNRPHLFGPGSVAGQDCIFTVAS